MNVVQPIRDPEVVTAIAEYLRLRSERNYLLFSLGVYSGLRVSDLLNLKVHKVRGTHVDIYESKTKKWKKFIIHPNIREDLDAYIADMDDDEYLFASRQKKRNGVNRRPIDRSQAYKILNDAARRFGLKEIGCHTMRKTFGYHLVMNADPEQTPFVLALLMQLFNHSSQEMTLRYLGLTQDALDRAVLKMSYTKNRPVSHSHFYNRRRA